MLAKKKTRGVRAALLAAMLCGAASFGASTQPAFAAKLGPYFPLPNSFDIAGTPREALLKIQAKWLANGLDNLKKARAKVQDAVDKIIAADAAEKAKAAEAVEKAKAAEAAEKAKAAEANPPDAAPKAPEVATATPPETTPTPAEATPTPLEAKPTPPKPAAPPIPAALEEQLKSLDAQIDATVQEIAIADDTTPGKETQGERKRLFLLNVHQWLNELGRLATAQLKTAILADGMEAQVAQSQHLALTETADKVEKALHDQSVEIWGN